MVNLDASEPRAGPAGRDTLDVVAIGSALVDVLTRVEDDELRRLQLTKGSMTLVDLARSDAVYRAMPPATEMSGGSAANTAVGVAALGGRAGFVGKVAADELGSVFLHDIEAAGVDAAVSSAPRDGTELATGRCLVLVTGDSERTMATHLGAASELGPEDLDERFIDRASVVYLEGYLWDLEHAKAAMRRATRIAHDGEGLVAFSASDPFCVRRHQREFLDLLRDDIDVLFANEEEARLLFGVSSIDAVVAAIEETGLLAAVTRGGQGSVVVTPAGPVEVAAEPVASVVDTTGAGDLYAAGFLYGLTHGLEPVQCGSLGGLCAAEIIAHLGARPQQDLRRLAAEHELL